MKNKVFLIISVMVLLIGLFISCGETKTKTNPELEEYFSNPALKYFPNEYAVVAKVDSLQKIYDEFEIEYINEVIKADDFNKLKEEAGFNPLKIDELEKNIGVTKDKPIIGALYSTELKGIEEFDKTLTKEGYSDILGEMDKLIKNNEDFELSFIMGIPIKDKEQILKQDLIKDKQIFDHQGAAIYSFDEYGFFFKDDYMILTSFPKIEYNSVSDNGEKIEINRNTNREYIIEKLKEILSLPESKSLASDNEYKKRMNKQKAESMINVVFDSEDGKSLAYSIIPIMYSTVYNDMSNPLLTQQFEMSTFISNLMLGQMDSFNNYGTYGIIDFYKTDTTFELSSFTDYKYKSMVSNHKFIQTTPGNVTLLFGFDMTEIYKSDGNSNKIDKLLSDYEDDEYMGFNISEIEDILGISIDELLQAIEMKGGYIFTDFTHILTGKMMFFIDLKDPEKIEKALQSLYLYLKEEFAEYIDISEDEGIYSILYKSVPLPYEFTFGVEGDTLLMASTKQHYKDILNAKEKFSAKVISEGLKDASNKQSTMLFHMDFVDIIKLVKSSMAMISNNSIDNETFERVTELFKEFNGYTINVEDGSDTILELQFGKKDFMKEFYNIIYNVYNNFSKAI